MHTAHTTHCHSMRANASCVRAAGDSEISRVVSLIIVISEVSHSLHSVFWWVGNCSPALIFTADILTAHTVRLPMISDWKQKCICASFRFFFLLSFVLYFGCVMQQCTHRTLRPYNASVHAFGNHPQSGCVVRKRMREWAIALCVRVWLATHPIPFKQQQQYAL